MQIIYDLSDLDNTVAAFWKLARHYSVITFSGSLGAGKTTFISALCKRIGVREKTSSPTFALINQYAFMEDGRLKIIYHTDWYRLRDEEEAIQAGIEDILNPQDGYCFIEWPEKAPGLVPEAALQVSIDFVSENIRKLQTH